MPSNKNSWTAEPPELTAEDFARMRAAENVVPGVVQAYRRTRGSQKAPKKELTTIRLDADVKAYFKAEGRGWQTRINNVLRQAMTRGRRIIRTKRAA
jgi:uncharacterized protein (DUF4415 family)